MADFGLELVERICLQDLVLWHVSQQTVMDQHGPMGQKCQNKGTLLTVSTAPSSSAIALTCGSAGQVKSCDDDFACGLWRGPLPYPWDAKKGHLLVHLKNPKKQIAYLRLSSSNI